METAAIRVESWNEFKERSLDIAGEPTGNVTGISFPDVETLRSTLSTKRMELIDELASEGPSSGIRQLAHRLDRPVSEVHRDVTALEEYDIVTLTEDGSSKRVECPYTSISIQYTFPT